MLRLRRIGLTAVLLSATILAQALASISAPAASAQVESCAELLDHPPLAGNPAVFSASSTQAMTGVRAYCNVQVVWRDPTLRGASGGYADPPDAQNNYQHIRMGFALPLNTNSGDAAWGGRLILTAGGGAQGSVPGLTGMIGMSPAAMGAGTDSGHGTSDSASGDGWGVVQGEGLNHGKVKDWAGGRSNCTAVRLAKELALTYYGSSVERTYWSGFSGGGHMGWTQALFCPEEYDGLLLNAPANHWQKFRLADSWDELVRKKVAQQTTPITAGQMQAANDAARAACDVIPGVDDVQDGIIADPRHCTWSARSNICGVEGAPLLLDCLNEIQADGIDRMWDGPRNGYGRRIWPAYDRGINLGTGTAAQGSTAQVLRWAMFDNNFPASNLYVDQESIDLAAAMGTDVSRAITYEDAALLVSQRTADFADADFVEMLSLAHSRGIKIIVHHGTADSAIHWRNALDMYVRAAGFFANGTPDFEALRSWYRFFPVPGAGHSSVNSLPQLIDWVEIGVVPERIERTTGFRVLCPFPQRAIYTGPEGGSTTDPNNFQCGGDLQTNEVICLGLRTPYKEETSDKLQAYGSYDETACTQASAQGSKTTGGGWLEDGAGNKLTFGFNAVEGEVEATGQLQLNDRARGVQVHVAQLSSIGAVGEGCGSIEDSERALEFRGSGSYNGEVGASFRVCVEDNGQGSGTDADLLYLECTDGCDYSTGVHTPDDAIDGGNIQVRRTGSSSATSDPGGDEPQPTTLILGPVLLSESPTGQPLTLTVSVYDQYQEPLRDAVVVLTASGSGAFSLTAVTDVSGIVALTVVSTTEVAEYRATAGGAESNTVEVSAHGR